MGTICSAVNEVDCAMRIVEASQLSEYKLAYSW